MKRSCLIFLELAILWSKVYSWPQEFNPDSNGNVPWAVNVQSLGGRLFEEELLGNQTVSVRKAFENVLCAGVAIDWRFFFVPGICVAGFKAKDLIVVHQTTGDTRPVQRIAFWGVHSNEEYAILTVRQPMGQAGVLPTISRWDVASEFDCYVSNFWNEDKVPREGKFHRFPLNRCNKNGVFISYSAAKILYASPLVCEAQDTKQLMLVGYYAWAFPMDDVSDFMCFADKASLANSRNIISQGVDDKHATCSASRLRVYCAYD